MTFFFDARYIRVGIHDGISRFSANLYREASKLIDLTAIINDLGQLKHLPADCQYILESPVDSIRELGFARRMNRRGARVVFSPMQTTGSLGKKFKLILTLHDLIYYQYRTPPTGFSWPVRLLWRLYHLTTLPGKLVLRQADALVTVSKSTATEIRRHRLYADQITVIPNAVESSFVTLPKVGKPDQALLELVYVGSFIGYKDVPTLVRAAGLISKSRLHLASPIAESTKKTLENLARRVGATVIFHDGLTDAEYIALLDQSDFLVSASRSEGFGIPVLEGFARKLPAVLSDIPVFHEVAEAAAVYFTPGDARDCARAILEAIENRETLQNAAARRVTEFSWEESGRRLAELIKASDSPK